jgi:hypothetical protein
MQTGVTPIKISISNLSAFTGLSVEIVSSNLNYFVEINAIEIADNTISIKNFDILHKTSGNT